MTGNGQASRTPSTLESSEARRSAALSSNDTNSFDNENLTHADLDFVRKLIELDGVAWAEITTKYRNAILRGIARGFSELNVALTAGGLEEVCAEVVFVLFKNDCAALRNFEGRSTFATWLTVVSRRVCLAKQLNQQRLVSGNATASSGVDLNSLPERGSSSELAEDLEAGLQAIRACLPQLLSADRSIIEKFFFEEQSYQEIASNLGITMNAVGPKLTRARSRLRQLIAVHQQRELASSQKLDPENPKHGHWQ